MLILRSCCFTSALSAGFSIHPCHGFACFSLLPSSIKLVSVLIIMALNILTLNVNRVHDNAKHAGTLQLLLVLPSVPDVLSVQ